MGYLYHISLDLVFKKKKPELLILYIYKIHKHVLFTAWETLGVAAKKVSYNSVDPEFDESVPSTKDCTKDNFYDLFKPAFIRNARYDIFIFKYFKSDFTNSARYKLVNK